MQVKTVSVTYGRKLNLGDYNSADISITIWADVKEDEDPQAALDGLFTQAKSTVKEQAMPLIKGVPMSFTQKETFLGKEVQKEKSS